MREEKRALKAPKDNNALAGSEATVGEEKPTVAPLEPPPAESKASVKKAAKKAPIKKAPAKKTVKKSSTKKATPTKPESTQSAALTIEELDLGAWVVFNCMRKDLHMWVGEGKKRMLVKIPYAPSPELLYTPESPETKTILVSSPTHKKTYPSGVLTEYKEMKTIGVLQEPKQLPNTIYLVEPEDVLQFPERTDFYTPATYELVKRSDVEKFLKPKKKTKKNKKQNKKNKKRDYAWELNIVASFTRIPYGKREADSPLFNEEYFIDATRKIEPEKMRRKSSKKDTHE